jgi:hypothetical protein
MESDYVTANPRTESLKKVTGKITTNIGGNTGPNNSRSKHDFHNPHFESVRNSLVSETKWGAICQRKSSWSRSLTLKYEEQARVQEWAQ